MPATGPTAAYTEGVAKLFHYFDENKDGKIDV